MSETVATYQCTQNKPNEFKCIRALDGKCTSNGVDQRCMHIGALDGTINLQISKKVEGENLGAYTYNNCTLIDNSFTHTSGRSNRKNTSNNYFQCAGITDYLQIVETMQRHLENTKTWVIQPQESTQATSPFSQHGVAKMTLDTFPFPDVLPQFPHH